MTRGIAYAIGFAGLSLSFCVMVSSMVAVIVVACHG